MERTPDYIIEIGGMQTGDAPPSQVARAHALRGRPWLAVHWRCCHVYNRVYRNRTGDAYVGGCPSCGRRLRARIGPGGMTGRFFTAE